MHLLLASAMPRTIIFGFQAFVSYIVKERAQSLAQFSQWVFDMLKKEAANISFRAVCFINWAFVTDMNSIRDLIRRHRRKFVVTVGIVGGGYALYRVFRAYSERMLALEQEKEAQRRADERADEFVEAQLQAHFESIQKISNSTTLPIVLENLKGRLFEELDISDLTERLMQGKGHPHTLSSQEKLQLWEKLKILSFTRTSCALWAVTLLNLYVRAQLNILGRHLYIDTARSFGNLEPMEQFSTLSKICQHKFLGSADYLPHYGVNALIFDMQKVIESILESKHLREPFTIDGLYDIFTKILKNFSSRSAHWINYIIPENGILFEEFSAGTSAFGASQLPAEVLSPFESERAKLEQLMTETRAVLSSNEFGTILDVSLKSVLDGMMEEFYTTFEGITSAGIPLAKLLAPVAQISTVLLGHPTQNRFINIIGNLPQVQSFYALLYANGRISQ
eukprot:Gb_37523 [translate_table: standard]